MVRTHRTKLGLIAAFAISIAMASGTPALAGGKLTFKKSPAAFDRMIVVTYFSYRAVSPTTWIKMSTNPTNPVATVDLRSPSVPLMINAMISGINPCPPLATMATKRFDTGDPGLAGVTDQQAKKSTGWQQLAATPVTFKRLGNGLVVPFGVTATATTDWDIAIQTSAATVLKSVNYDGGPVIDHWTRTWMVTGMLPIVTKQGTAAETAGAKVVQPLSPG